MSLFLWGIYRTMLYRDVDRSIGYMLSVSMVQSHPLIPVMEKELGEVPLHTDRIGEESYIDLFVQGGRRLQGSRSWFRPMTMR